MKRATNLEATCTEGERLTSWPVLVGAQVDATTGAIEQSLVTATGVSGKGGTRLQSPRTVKMETSGGCDPHAGFLAYHSAV